MPASRRLRPIARQFGSLDRTRRGWRIASRRCARRASLTKELAISYQPPKPAREPTLDRAHRGLNSVELLDALEPGRTRDEIDVVGEPRQCCLAGDYGQHLTVPEQRAIVLILRPQGEVDDLRIALGRCACPERRLEWRQRCVGIWLGVDQHRIGPEMRAGIFARSG